MQCLISFVNKMYIVRIAVWTVIPITRIQRVNSLHMVKCLFAKRKKELGIEACREFTDGFNQWSVDLLLSDFEFSRLHHCVPRDELFMNFVAFCHVRRIALQSIFWRVLCYKNTVLLFMSSSRLFFILLISTISTHS